MNKPDLKHINRKGLLRLLVVAAFCCAFFMVSKMYGLPFFRTAKTADKLQISENFGSPPFEFRGILRGAVLRSAGCIW